MKKNLFQFEAESFQKIWKKFLVIFGALVLVTSFQNCLIGVTVDEVDVKVQDMPQRGEGAIVVVDPSKDLLKAKIRLGGYYLGARNTDVVINVFCLSADNQKFHHLTAGTDWVPNAPDLYTVTLNDKTPIFGYSTAIHPDCLRRGRVRPGFAKTEHIILYLFEGFSRKYLPILTEKNMNCINGLGNRADLDILSKTKLCLQQDKRMLASQDELGLNPSISNAKTFTQWKREKLVNALVITK